MIVSQNTSSEAHLIGDITNNKVGIDRNNIDFITTLLTSNLYSKPVQSFIRETVANGWDSQIEAGNTEVPLLIRLTVESGRILVSVRDYGTGLSPERFQDIYLNIGSSTKRESNDYIGMMGIGRFACLACSDVANITSYYNGTCYQYLMYKDGSGICIDKVGEFTTDVENGLEVQVNIGNQWDWSVKGALKEGITALHFYSNVYVSDEGSVLDAKFIESFNNRKIHSLQNFKVTSSPYYIGCNVLMGNVCYPLRDDLQAKYFPGASTSIAIVCPIGSLDITPNREQLLYNERTEETLKERLQASLDEIRNICRIQFGGDFKTVHEWYEFTTWKKLIVTLYSFEDFNVVLNIDQSEISHYTFTVKHTINGRPIPYRLKELYEKFICSRVSSKLLLYNFKNKKFYQYKEEGYTTTERYIQDYEAGYVYGLSEPYKPVTKQYLCSILPTDRYSVRFVSTKNFTLKYILHYLRVFTKAYTNGIVTPAIKLIYRDFIKNYTKPKEFNNSDVPKEFLTSLRKTPSKTQRSKARKCVVYTLIDGCRYDHGGLYNVVTDNKLYDSEALNKFKGTIIYDTIGSAKLRLFYKLFRVIKGEADWVSKCIFVEVAPSNIPVLKGLKNSIGVNEFTEKKVSCISKLLTAFYLADHYNIEPLCDRNTAYGTNYQDIPVLLEHNPDIQKFSNKLDTYIKFIQWYSVINIKDEEKAILVELYTFYLKKGWLDMEFLDGMKTNTTFLDLKVFLSKIYDRYSNLSTSIAIASFLEKRKFGVLNLSAWTDLNTIFNPIYQHESIQIAQSSSTDS